MANTTKSGTAYAIYVTVGSQPTIVAGHRGIDLSKTADTIDVSSADDYPHRVYEYSWLSSELTLDGVRVVNDAAQALLESALDTQDTVTVREYRSSVAKREATALVTAFRQNTPQSGEATFTVTLKITGAWAAV